MRLELSIALRYLRRRRRGSKFLSLISAIAVGGVVVGVAVLIVVTGIMTGLQRDLREKLLIGTADIRVVSNGRDQRMDDWRSVLATVRQERGVVSASPFVTAQCIVKGSHAFVTAGYVVGLGESGSSDVTDIRRHAKSGDFRFASDDGFHRGVVPGKLMAGVLDAYVGDTLTLVCLSKASASSLGDGVPPGRRLQITGVFETGMYNFDNSFLYVDMPVAQELAGLASAVNGIEIRTRSRADAEPVSRRIAAHLGSRFKAIAWQTDNQALLKALNLERAAMALILFLVVLVAAFNIVSVLTMVVVEKTREIGILKAIGLSSRAVRLVFALQGLVIGMIGTGIGAALGLVVSFALDRYQLVRLNAEVYSVDHLPVTTVPLDVVMTILASVAIAMLATLYPSVQAGRLYPVEAIRAD
jgi:lipoprotein-releasing system permease protein